VKSGVRRGQRYY
jgi:hypothetical protein